MKQSPTITVKSKNNTLAKLSSTKTSETSEDRNMICIPNIRLRNSDSHMDNFTDMRKRERKRLSWTRQELDALMDGVKSCGEGKWTTILKKYADRFHQERRVIDLVHKYRQLKKESSFYRTPKKNWVEIDEDNNDKTDAMGDVICYSEKFPYDAAMKFAKRNGFQGYRTYIVRIREFEDTTNIHTYSVSVDSERIKLKKLVSKDE